MTTSLETLERHAAHGGTVGYYRHPSKATGTNMTFGLFTPPAAPDGQHGTVPVVKRVNDSRLKSLREDTSQKKV